MEQSTGHTIRAARLARGWTQKQLSEAAGVSTIAIKRLEADQHAPSAESARRLARALAIPITDLLREDDDLAGPFPAANWRGKLDARLLRRYGRLWATADRRDRTWIKGQLDLFVQAEAHVRSLEAKAQAQAGGAAESDTDPPFADDEPDPVVQYVGA